MKALTIALWLLASAASAEIQNIHLWPALGLEWKSTTPGVTRWEVWWQQGEEKPKTDVDWGTKLDTNTPFIKITGLTWKSRKVWYLIVEYDKDGRELHRTPAMPYTIQAEGFTDPPKRKR